MQRFVWQAACGGPVWRHRCPRGTGRSKLSSATWFASVEARKTSLGCGSMREATRHRSGRWPSCPTRCGCAPPAWTRMSRSGIFPPCATLRRVFLRERTIRWQVARGLRGNIYAIAAGAVTIGLLAIGGYGAMGSLGEIVLVNPVDGTLGQGPPRTPPNDLFAGLFAGRKMAGLHGYGRGNAAVEPRSRWTSRGALQAGSRDVRPGVGRHDRQTAQVASLGLCRQRRT